MISYSDLRRGMMLDIDGEPHQVIEWQHQKMQQRAPVLTIKLRHLRSGKVIERNMPGNQKLALASMVEKEAQYMYSDGSAYFFMDTESYDQFPLPEEQIRYALSYLKGGEKVRILYYKNAPFTLELPNFVDLKIVDTSPVFKGDTAQGGNKPATLETGLSIKVPMHLNAGDLVRVDTRSGQYVEKVS
ncbi:MAG: elongation factor P [Chloroflexi bacterium]|nr:elongation factor P [Chloroflexota bacterium]